MAGRSVEIDLATQRATYVSELEAALERIVARLSAMPDVLRVILFGSYARGRRDLFTDLDLLVVQDSDRDFVTRTAAVYQRLEPGVDLDLFVYTPEEFERMRSHGLVRHAVETGRVLLAREPG